MAEPAARGRDFWRLAQPALIFAGFVLVIACLFFARKVLIPIALAVLLTFLLTPVVNALERLRLRSAPAVALTVLLTFTALGGAGWLLYGQVAALADDLPQYKDNIMAKIRTLRRAGKGGTLEKAQSTVKEVIGELQKEDAPAEARKPAPVVVKNDEPALKLLPTSIGPLAELLATVGLVIVLVIFMLLERQRLLDRLIRLGGYGRLTVTTKVLDEAGQLISRYLLMQSVVNAGFGIAIGTGLYVIGVPYALLFGVLAGLFRFVPYVGPWLGASLPMVMALAASSTWTEPLAVLGLFVAVELAIYMVVEPLLLSHSIGLSPLALLITVAFWTWLWGPIGLILGTPLTACLVVLGKYVPELNFIVVLFSDEPLISPAVAFYQRLVKGDQDEATAVLQERLKAGDAERIYDDVLVPALSAARRDAARGALTGDELRFIVTATREIADDVADEAAADRAATRPIVEVLGCPARDDADEVALVLFRRLVAPVRVDVQVAPAAALASELVARAEESLPGLVLIAALPPGGAAQARYLVKRLRARLPAVPIVVGRWSAGEDDATREALLQAGANHVGATLLETRGLVLQYARGGTDTAEHRAA